MSGMNAFNSAFNGAGGFGNAADPVKSKEIQQQYSADMRKRLGAVVLPNEQRVNVSGGLDAAMLAMNTSAFGNSVHISPFGNNPGALNVWNSMN